jgi:DNA anti-recombination protein RmuC
MPLNGSGGVMKALSIILIIITMLLSFLLLRAGDVFSALEKSQKELIAADQSLEKAINNFSKQIDPIVKRFGR